MSSSATLNLQIRRFTPGAAIVHTNADATFKMTPEKEWASLDEIAQQAFDNEFRILAPMFTQALAGITGQ